MDKVQKIREELERLREQLQDKVETSDFIAGEVFIMNYFLSFIDTLQEEPVSEDLEEDIHKEIIKLHTAPCYDELKAFARHFAQWQKHQDDLIIKQAKICYRLLGKQQMKEEMMKGSFNGSVAKSGRAPYHLCVSAEIPKRCEVAFGDKVKVIIIKEG